MIPDSNTQQRDQTKDKLESRESKELTDAELKAVSGGLAQNKRAA